MALTPISLLLLRRFSFVYRVHRPSVASLHFSTSSLPASNPTSTGSQVNPSSASSTSSPSSLSARMSFIFEQIDEIEKQTEEKDQTLQRIRAWRQSKQQQSVTNSFINEEDRGGEGGVEGVQEAVLKTEENTNAVLGGDENVERVLEGKEGVVRRNEVEVAHPWPEWIELMERLVKQNYFDHRRKDEDKMVRELGFDDDVGEENVGGVDFSDFKLVQTACLNFGKDRFDILRSLSRQDIQILVGYGCPSADKKVVFSAKLLRKHAHLDEGDICSSCSLRSSCERAYLLTNKEDEARTIDVMRVLLTYGFDPINGSVTNKSLLKQKSVKTVVRKLLHEIVKLSAVPIDPNLPPPVIKKPPPKVKQPPPPPKKRVGRDDVEMKKGDWLCPKCDFMNFAKNTVCLQCDAKRPKRQLLPGEWECPECNFLNYRRNMACFHCDCKRPPDDFLENKLEERRQGPNMRMDNIPKRQEVSNAWNFDFDDDESDGADVAAYEYADSSSRMEDSSSHSQPHAESFRGYGDNLDKANTARTAHERGHSDNRLGIGFDDFDDEDDIDSYEIDTPNSYSVRKVSSNDLSEGFSEAEDFEGSGGNFHRTSSRSNNKSSNLRRRRPTSEDGDLDFDDSDEELPAHPNWKSSHVADSRHRGRGRGPTGPSSRRLSFGSDEEFGPLSDLDDEGVDDFKTRPAKRNTAVSSRNHRRRGHSDNTDYSDSDFDDGRSNTGRNRFGPNKMGTMRRGNNSGSSERYNFVNDGNKSFRGPRGRMNGGDNPRSNNRGKMNDRRDFSRSNRGSKHEGFGKPRRGMSSKYNKDDNFDAREFRNSRRVIER